MSPWLLPAATAAWWAGLLLGFGPARSLGVWAPGVLGVAAIVSAIVCLLLVPKLNSWMHEDVGPAVDDVESA